MELTPKQQKRLDKLVALEDNANLVIVDEIGKIKDVVKKIADKKDPEQRDNIAISNPQDITEEIVSSVNSLFGLIKSHYEEKDAKQERYTKVSIIKIGV